jgi:transposase, IS5 family
VASGQSGFPTTPQPTAEEATVRRKRNLQDEFDFQPSNLKITNDYFRRYTAIDQMLRETPAILDLVHRDLRKALEGERKRNRKFPFTSETVLRMVIVEKVEQEVLRGLVIRIDDSCFLRRFVGIHNGNMMDFSTHCKLKNAIRPETWKRILEALNKGAVEAGRISGDKLRLDTTAVETNIHYPTDSSLLWDVYRVLARRVRAAREIDPEVVGDQRLQEKTAKRHMTWISRKASKKRTGSSALKERYEALFDLVEGLLSWAHEVATALRKGIEQDAYDYEGALLAEAIALDLERDLPLGRKVVDQTQRRVLHDEKVPATEKLYSIFEEHTELLKRGKANKPMEFGHMVLFQQVEEKYITDYGVFLRRPNEHTLVDPALESHRDLFGTDPDVLSADKGFYESMDKIHRLGETIGVVAIGKKGKRSEAEIERESSVAYKEGQRFRAGIEGTISFLKRALRLARCFSKGWKHFAATVGATVFAHNLLVLARGYG